MNMMKLLLLCLLGLLPVIAPAETSAEKGLAIAVEADARDKGFGDSTASMDMILRNRQGDESRREVRVRTLEVDGDGDKSLALSAVAQASVAHLLEKQVGSVHGQRVRL